jgi:hypothetical protein
MKIVADRDDKINIGRASFLELGDDGTELYFLAPIVPLAWDAQSTTVAKLRAA